MIRLRMETTADENNNCYYNYITLNNYYTKQRNNNYYSAPCPCNEIVSFRIPVTKYNEQ